MGKSKNRESLEILNDVDFLLVKIAKPKKV